MTETGNADRRLHERRLFERPCKLLHGPSLRYICGQTRDLSSGGVLLEVVRPSQIAVGDQVSVLVDWAHKGLVGRDSMLPATVAWIRGERDGSRLVGVEFDEALTVSRAA